MQFVGAGNSFVGSYSNVTDASELGYSNELLRYIPLENHFTSWIMVLKRFIFPPTDPPSKAKCASATRVARRLIQHLFSNACSEEFL